MARPRYQSYFVVEKGDTLSFIAGQIYGSSSLEKVRELAKQNSHIKDPNLIKPGQIIYIGGEPGSLAARPDVGDLKEAEAVFQDPVERKFLLENWDTLTVLQEGSFVTKAGVMPSQLLPAFPPGTVKQSSEFALMSYGVGKDLLKVAEVTALGKFGNFIKTDPRVWTELQGTLVRSFKREVAYVRQSSGAFRMIPKTQRAFLMNGKIISVTNSGSGLREFSLQAKAVRQLGRDLHKLGKLTAIFDAGIAAVNIGDKWDSPERNRVIVKESVKFGLGLSTGGVSNFAATGICGALTFTTGIGGISCYLVVYLVSNQVFGRLADSGADLASKLVVLGATNQTPVETK